MADEMVCDGGWEGQRVTAAESLTSNDTTVSISLKHDMTINVHVFLKMSTDGGWEGQRVTAAESLTSNDTT